MPSPRPLLSLALLSAISALSLHAADTPKKSAPAAAAPKAPAYATIPGPIRLYAGDAPGAKG
ncbi:MAG TPA: hypothetical protein VGE76_09310, partial [Opitutaceae bacterium]